MLSNKNLLVLLNTYRYGLKNLIESTSPYFNHIYVIVRYNPIAEVSNFLPIDYLKTFRKKSLVDLENLPGNITIYTAPIIYAPIERHYRTLGDKHFAAVNKIITEHKISFDIMHAHFTWSQGYVGCMLKKMYNIPYILTVHEDKDWLLKEVNSGNEKMFNTWKNSDLLVRVNKADIPILKNYNKNIINLPNGFDPTKFHTLDKESARKSLNLPLDKIILFSLGNLVTQKGHEYLIDAANDLIKERTDFIIFIGGEGQMKRSLNSKIKRNNLENYVKLIGQIPNRIINLWMNSADLFILPSLSESFGIVQVEAMACGKPVVATINGGSEEVINSDCGILCEKANSKALADSISLAMKAQWDKDLIKEYAIKYIWASIAKKNVELYKDVLNRTI